MLIVQDTRKDPWSVRFDKSEGFFVFCSSHIFRVPFVTEISVAFDFVFFFLALHPRNKLSWHEDEILERFFSSPGAEMRSENDDGTFWPSSEPARLCLRVYYAIFMLPHVVNETEGRRRRMREWKREGKTSWSVYVRRTSDLSFTFYITSALSFRTRLLMTKPPKDLQLCSLWRCISYWVHTNDIFTSS